MINDRRIARRYAKAFLHKEIAPADLDRMTEELKAIVKALESDQGVHEFFVNPVTKKKDKLASIGNISDKLGLSALTKSMLELLVKKDRFAIIDAVAAELQDASDMVNDRVRVVLTTSREPSADEIDDIAGRIGTFFKRRTVVERKIEPSIIDGFIIEGDGKMIDMSITGQLRRILTKV